MQTTSKAGFIATTCLVLTPHQAAAKNHNLPPGYQFVPTGLLTACNDKRKRKPTEMHSVERISKVPSQEELAAKEKQHKIALLKKRLQLLKSRQLVLATTQSLPFVSIEPRVGKRVKKAVIKDLPSPPRITPSKPGRATVPKKQSRAKEQSPALQQQLADLTSTVANLSKQLAQKPRTSVSKNLNLIPPTNREKQMLKGDIVKLPSEKWGPIIQMCSQNSGVEDKSEGSVTIDIDKLDIPTFRKLQKYVKKCLNQVSRKGPPKTLPIPPKQTTPKQTTPSPMPPAAHADSHLSESDSDSSSSSSDSDSESESELPQSNVSSGAPSFSTSETLAWRNLELGDVPLGEAQLEQHLRPEHEQARERGSEAVRMDRGGHGFYDLLDTLG